MGLDKVMLGPAPARARPHACCCLAAALAILLLPGGCSTSARAQAAPATPVTAPPAAPSPRPAPVQPTRPAAALWPTVRLYNIDYIDGRDIAARYGLKAAWAVRDKVMQLSDERGAVRLKFEDRNRDFHLDGARIFMGERTVSYNGSLYVSKIDVIKTIAPLLRPAEHAHLLPAPPKLIVLDAGHGGNDPGKQNRPLRLDEKDLTLDVALRLKKLLEARGYSVLLTRADDRRLAAEPLVDLQRRADVANRAKADLFLSIHFNAVVPKDAARVAGSETYGMTPQFQLSSADDKKDEMTNVAFPGNRQDCANTVLGYHLHRQLLAGLKTSDRGYKRARFVVLRFVECPGALLEAAYLSNDAEARRIATPDFRQQVAQAIAAGVDDYAAVLAQLRKQG